MKDMQDYEIFRSRLLKSLTDELFGPEPTDSEERQAELLDVSPLQLYSTGVLFPQRTIGEQLEDDSEASSTKDVGPDSSESDHPEVTVDLGRQTDADIASIDDQPLNLANEFNPSAMGLTIKVPSNVHLRVQISAGRYVSVKLVEPHPKAGQEKADGTTYPSTRVVERYKRIAINDVHEIDVGLDPVNTLPLTVAGSGEYLRLHVRVRRDTSGAMVVSLALVNFQKASEAKAPSYAAAFFQVCLKVTDTLGKPLFLPIDRAGGMSDDAEVASLNLLYREKHSFALGHGCGADWLVTEDAPGTACSVSSAFIPRFDLKLIRPREKPFGDHEFNLSMRGLSDGEGRDVSAHIVRQLEGLADDYASWIASCESKISSLAPEFRDAARRHLDNCSTCLKRMREGIRYLLEDASAMLAFRLANRAMLIQQVRVRLPDRNYNEIFLELPSDYVLSGTNDPTWRPFQLAFLLMNVACCGIDDHPDRSIVDLIWFPTGGGKTEAYLGLAAYCICLRRIRNRDDRGVAVLMRYTLRLLTAQQFQRAAALITALDVLRTEACYSADLGKEPISIGLWVGMGLSPNRRSDAIQRLRKMRGSEGERNQFQLLRCPWCRTKLDHPDALGYYKEPLLPGGDATVVFRCPNRGCRWSQASERLPVVVIDDDIYDSPPTLLLGTVDKFAQLAWEPRSGRLFGINTTWSPPSLIIQDELHLISGPLGTIVGLYETLIDELCTADGVQAKIVASTATIRESREQCRSIYARNRFEFPPQCLDAGDSYFALEDGNAPGRLYVGVFGTAVKSHATAQVRVVAPLLQAVMPRHLDHAYNAQLADGYATVLWYFNSLRELGHAVTMCTGDIPEHHFNLCRRWGIDKDHRRLIRNVQELTSRRTSEEIPRILDDLNRQWAPTPEKLSAVDILLATNMISVGVDVGRLGVMLISGQPKSTSEYIQATSRVGRSFPGLVVSVYNPARSRDRSHYEQFIGYHQAIYRHVEPTSVTPFSAPARSRAFAGLVIAMARLIAGVSSPGEIRRHSDDMRRIREHIIARVAAVDESELADADVELAKILQQWTATAPSEFGRMSGMPDTRTLMFPYGRTRHETFEAEAFPVLTSMRNVDATCSAHVLARYPSATDGEMK